MQGKKSHKYFQHLCIHKKENIIFIYTQCHLYSKLLIIIPVWNSYYLKGFGKQVVIS